MRVVLLILSLASVVFASAQSLPMFYDTTELSQMITLNGSIDFSASAVKNDISGSFIRGGFITNEMKDFSMDKHGAVNRIGGTATGEIIYSNFNKRLIKNKPWGLQLKAGTYYFGGMLYSQDLFGFGFYGNERYIGDTIDLSGTDVSYMSFEKIGFGLIDNKSKSSLTFNVYNISNRVSADLRDARIVQSADSNYIEIIMDGDIQLRNSLQYNQGIGFGFDFNYFLNIDWQAGKTAFIQFKAENIGFAYMYEDQQRYTFDTTFTYQGLTFEQITGENSILQDSLDVLDTLGIASSTVNPTVLLPGYIQIAKIVDDCQDKKLQSFFGLRMYPTLIFAPYIYAGVDYKPMDKLHLGALMSYGGFTAFRSGLYASYATNTLQIGLGTENLIGLFSKKGNGQSLNIRLSCVF